MAVVVPRQVTVAAAAAAASWSPAARRRAAAGRPGRRLWVLLHCKPREASGAASLLVNLVLLMRVAHYEVILTCIDAPRMRQRPRHKASSARLEGARPHSRPARTPAWGAVDWSRGLVDQSQPAKSRRPQTRGLQQSTAHLDGIGCPATGGTSLGSPWPPFYLFVSLGGGEPNDDKIC